MKCNPRPELLSDSRCHHWVKVSSEQNMYSVQYGVQYSVYSTVYNFSALYSSSYTSFEPVPAFFCCKLSDITTELSDHPPWVTWTQNWYSSHNNNTIQWRPTLDQSVVKCPHRFSEASSWR